MSVQAITWAYAQLGLTGTQKFVLVTLGNYANADWECWPSVDMLSAATGLDEKAVRRALKHLESDRYLTRERERLQDGSLGRYRYLLDRLRMPEGGFQTVPNASEKNEGNLGAGPKPGGQKSQRNHGPGSPPAPKEKETENRVRAQSPVRQPPGLEPARTTGLRARSTKPSLEDNRHKEETSVVVETPSLNSTFAEIWNMWPGQGRQRSKSKAKCLDALVRALGNRQPAMMVEAVRRFVKTIDNPKFVPALDRWLKDERFEHFWPSAELHQLPLSQTDDWSASITRWAADGYWPSKLGPAPTQVGYRGPIEPLEAMLPDLGDHPVAREIRTTINQRKRA